MDKKEYVTIPISKWFEIKNICEYSYNRTTGFAEEKFEKLLAIIEKINNNKA